MQPTILQDRPPFVQFETRSIEDREASIAAGHYVGKDVDFAFITPAGSKDRIERVVSEWFEQLKADIMNERLPKAWFDSYKAAYDAFKSGNEAPVSGIALKDWPGLSPSVYKTLISLNLRAVEDVAAANEETLGRIGMGARALKQRAIDYLEASKNVGKVAEKASAATAENEQLAARNKALEEQLKSLQAQVNALAGGAAQMAQKSAPSTGISADDLGLGSKL